MGMTVSGLHKLLGDLINAGHGRKIACINKDSFRHALESDGAVILEVEAVSVRWIGNIDDDGGQKMNKNGTESGRMYAIISGGHEE